MMKELHPADTAPGSPTNNLSLPASRTPGDKRLRAALASRKTYTPDPARVASDAREWALSLGDTMPKGMSREEQEAWCAACLDTAEVFLRRTLKVGEAEARRLLACEARRYQQLRRAERERMEAREARLGYELAHLTQQLPPSRRPSGHAPRSGGNAQSRFTRRSAHTSSPKSGDKPPSDEPPGGRPNPDTSLYAGVKCCPICDDDIPEFRGGRKTRSDAETCPKAACKKQAWRLRKQEANEAKRRKMPFTGNGWAFGCKCTSRGPSGLSRWTYLDEELDLRCFGCGCLGSGDSRGTLVELSPATRRGLERLHGRFKNLEAKYYTPLIHSRDLVPLVARRLLGYEHRHSLAADNYIVAPLCLSDKATAPRVLLRDSRVPLSGRLVGDGPIPMPASTPAIEPEPTDRVFSRSEEAA